MEVSNNISRELATLRNEQNRSAIEHFGLSKKKPAVKARDTYTKSSECEEYLNYTRKDITETDIVVYKGELPREFVNLINGDGESPIIIYQMDDNLFKYNDVFFTRESIPKIPDSEFEEVRAVNNVIDFGKSNYFTYKGYRLYSSNKGNIRSISTEHFFEDDYGTEFYRFADFWNKCMDDVTHLGLLDVGGYTSAEMEYYLEEMGVDSDAGFVTIKMGEKENTLYHTKGKWFSPLINKDRYDDKYALMQTSKFGEDFGAGAVIKIGGKDYVFDENCQIKVPYGADIFDVEYPPVLHNR